MKKIFTVFLTLSLLVILMKDSYSQSLTANYTFTNATDGSLTDMTSGTFQLIGANSITGSGGSNSTLQNIGFDFVFMGNLYTTFGANSRGLIRFGSVPSVATSTNNLSTTANIPFIAPFWDNIGTSGTGEVKSKLTGSAPNRVLTVEWKNMRIALTGSTTADGTFQLRLYETTGKIEFVYGSMNIGTVSPIVTASIGFTNTNANNGLLSLTSISSPGVTTLTASVNNNLVNSSTAGAIPDLNSNSDGNRVIYSFTPPVPNPPTNLSFTNVTPGGMTLNWTDASNENLYILYNSTDGINFSFARTLTQGTIIFNASGLASSTNYTWKLYSVSEGGFSSALQGSQSTSAGLFSGVKTIGATGNYTTLTAAFSAINTDGLAGASILELQSDYSSSGETYPIAPGFMTGRSSTNNVTVRPASGVTGIIISSGINQTFTFNGTQFLKIDGRPGGIGSSLELTILNTTTQSPVMKFLNEASNNIVEYCKLKADNQSGDFGVISISTTTGISGNDNNEFNNCEISNRSGADAPSILVSCSGTSGKENDSLKILGCKLFNFSNAGIVAETGGTGNNFQISGNSFYQTSTPPAAVTNSEITDGINIKAGSGHIIINNFIGGQNVNCGGNSYLNTAFEFTFRGIILAAGNNSASTVQNNTIQNLNFTGGNESFLSFAGILISSGAVNIIGNTIGHNTVSNSISTASSFAGDVGINTPVGINNGLINVSNNIVANITKTGTTSGSSFIGIICASSGSTATNNVLHDLSNVYSITGINANTSTGATLPITISNNTLYAIRSTNSGTSNATATGITCGTSGGTGTGNISRNKIYDFTNTSTGATANIFGISAGNTVGLWTVSNNQIAITNANNTNAATIRGINLLGSGAINWNIYYNSIYIGGSASSGTFTSSCIFKGFANTSIEIKNNIFYNERTGGAGNHYAIDYTNTSNLTSDYNLLIGNADSLVRWGTAAYNFANYKITSSKDGFSYSNQPANIPASNLFTNVSSGNLNILAGNNEAYYCDGKAIAISSQADDYGSTGVRNTSITQGTTDIGSDEFTYAGSIPNLTASAPPALNTTSTYSFGGRDICSIAWGGTGTVPSFIIVRYYSGYNPQGTLTGQYSKAYWDAVVAGGSGYTYDATLNYTTAILFNIVNEPNIKMSKYDALWVYFPDATVNTTSKTVTKTGLTSFSSLTVTSSDAPLSAGLQLQLTALIEGFYNNVSNTTVQDTLRSYLRNTTSPYAIVDSAKGFFSSNGNLALIFSNASNGTYYVDLRHRNGLETWSAAGVTFTSGLASYNFTTDSSQAYAGNMKLKGSKYCIYSGDVTQLGAIDVSDVIAIYNDAGNFVSGYVMTDVNGDDFVDVTDMLIAYNNSINFVVVRNPIVGDVLNSKINTRTNSKEQIIISK